jgi:hypothetical protein
MRRHARAVLACAVLARAADVRALETGDVGGEPVHLDVTDVTSLLYSVNNRNSRPGDVSRSLDDDWGVWYNRLNTQASWKSWQMGLRLDSARFFATPDPTKVALDLLAERRSARPASPYSSEDAAFFVQRASEASRNLATQYTSWLYPAKYYVGYTGRDVEATVGDFYGQLGRGLVLSVRKQDELASDTTIRGGRVTGRVRSGDLRFRLTALGGVMNPLRFDEASGRYLGVTGSVTPGLAALTEAGMPRAGASPFDASVEPTLAPDRLVGAQLEGGTRALQIGVQGSMVDRTLLDRGNGPNPLSPGAVRSAESLRTGSVSLSAPDLGGHGAAYVEVALQGLTYPTALSASGADLPAAGHAVYASFSANQKPVTLTAEAKHYRRFFPLAANIDLARTAEFAAVQYNTPPTTEAFWVDTEYEGFNTCVSGGRLKGDVQVGQHATVFAWAGRYLTWAESVANPQCDTATDNVNRVWDSATGFEITSADRKSRATLTTGSRFDDSERLLPDPSGGQTHVFYREAYARYDLFAWLGGPFTLKLQGWDRRRHQTQGGVPGPWTELQQIVALDWAPHLTVGTGFEYTGNPQFPATYFNGMVAYAFNSSSNIAIFAGQRRGGLRCVSGVCRIYPPFEGVRLDATFRF